VKIGGFENGEGRMVNFTGLKDQTSPTSRDLSLTSGYNITGLILNTESSTYLHQSGSWAMGWKSLSTENFVAGTPLPHYDELVLGRLITSFSASLSMPYSLHCNTVYLK